MSLTISGIVKNGVIVPSAPLPEGTLLEIRVVDSPLEVTPDLQAELAAWQLAGAEALELVERLAQENEAHEEG
jgi:hypothetical protein